MSCERAVASGDGPVAFLLVDEHEIELAEQVEMAFFEAGISDAGLDYAARRRAEEIRQLWRVIENRQRDDED